MSALVRAGSGELGDPDVPRVKRSDQPSDSPALPRRVPALKEDAQRGPEFGGAEQAPHLKSKGEQPSLGASDAAAALSSTQLEAQVRITE
jgi:hypothetical protein